MRERVRAVNIDATRTLLELAEAAGVGRFVHTSSTATVLAPDAAGGDESLPYSTSSDLYTTSKVESEKIVRAHRGRMKTVAIRPGGIYGPGERNQLEPVSRIVVLVPVRSMSTYRSSKYTCSSPVHPFWMSS